MKTILLALFFTACAHREIPVEPHGLHRALVARQSNTDRKVEIFWKEPLVAKKPWPAVIYLHGNQESLDNGGRTFGDWGVLDEARDLGFLAVGVSLPGYGESSGPRDFCGPDSQQAVQDTIRYLRHRGDVVENKIALVGVSRGATVAAKVGEQVAGLAGVVLVSGFYDLGENFERWRHSPGVPEALALAAEFEHETVISDAGPLEITIRERSVLPDPQLRAPTLLLHGARDPLTVPLQAATLAERLRKRDVDARAVIYPEAGHRVPAEARGREIAPFLERVLKN